MNDTTITKIDSSNSPKGKMGQKYLASGITMGMRLWENEPPGKVDEPHVRPYETVGYAISGKAELEIEGQKVVLSPGDSWVVPKNARHAYRIVEPFTAIETTHPPAHVHGRDEE